MGMVVSPVLSWRTSARSPLLPSLLILSVLRSVTFSSKGDRILRILSSLAVWKLNAGAYELLSASLSVLVWNSANNIRILLTKTPSMLTLITLGAKTNACGA
jgi:hypothetical protein